MTQSFNCPKFSDERIIEFCNLHELGEPQQLDFTTVNSIYKKDYCHASVKHRVQQYGGKRVHGWALWLFETGYIVGNFHSVWEDPNGNLVEITPPKKGVRIIFVRDDRLSIKKSSNNHQLFNNRTHDSKQKIIDCDGQPTSNRRFNLPINEALKEYCKTLGWDNESMV